MGQEKAGCGSVSGLEWSASGAVKTEVLVCCGGVPPAKHENGPKKYRPARISIFIPFIFLFTEKYENGTESGMGCIPPVFAGSRF